ncbi:hypothetical protein CEN50_22820 [Fischerella thermalis CCMEE 5268]|uniref:Uncharacterized protein n=1 Tax=Fischerella thermalis CCMEE 5268 TaxID=2019662 RepID=A0A2N6KAG1_9CYAN|nr:hypothetical protein [Fischerella thermalis]PLZ95293.1 hypothetical protein CEN50_22820 [Fischerella thermalis CCMEE 5268]
MAFKTIPPDFWNLKLNQNFNPKPAQKAQQQPQQTKQQTNVDTGIQKKLINLLNGDKDICKRLIDAAKRKYPGQSEHWYWEKVTEDLLRDRA